MPGSTFLRGAELAGGVDDDLRALLEHLNRPRHAERLALPRSLGRRLELPAVAAPDHHRERMIRVRRIVQEGRLAAHVRLIGAVYFRNRDGRRPAGLLPGPRREDGARSAQGGRLSVGGVRSRRRSGRCRHTKRVRWFRLAGTRRLRLATPSRLRLAPPSRLRRRRCRRRHDRRQTGHGCRDHGRRAGGSSRRSRRLRGRLRSGRRDGRGRGRRRLRGGGHGRRRRRLRLRDGPAACCQQQAERDHGEQDGA
jgi:hypothetical protein